MSTQAVCKFHAKVQLHPNSGAEKLNRCCRSGTQLNVLKVGVKLFINVRITQILT